MRVQSFADRRSDRAVWEGTHWEWAVLRPEDGTFDAQSYVDLDAREKWFFQAQIESPAMFARSPGAGSLYWFCARDGGGAYLDGGHSYRLSVPLPVPDKLFSSVTVYDAETRAEIVTDENLAAPRSLVELPADKLGDADSVDLYFVPEQPDGCSGTRTASTSTSGPSSQTARTVAGSRRFRIGAGSSISVSTDLTRTRSTEPGDSQTSNSSTDPTAPTSDIGSHCWTVA